MSKAKAIAVTSGGMDSTTMAYKLHHDGHPVRLLHVDLKQKCEQREHEAVQRVADELGIGAYFVDCGWLGELGGSSLTDETIPVPRGMDSMRESKGIVSWEKEGLWTPARNVVLLATAAAHAERFGAEFITFGANQSETAYPDNTIEFADAFSEMLMFGCLKPPKVIVPLYELDKVQLLKWGYDNGYGHLYAYTWSCDNGFKHPCGVCGCCCNRRLAYWLLNKIEHKVYEDKRKYMDDSYFEKRFLPDMLKDKGKGFWWEKYEVAI
jgi:7-cyano-7-deazaguanine synthase